MAKINLVCDQCGGSVVLDDKHEFGTCDHCYATVVIKNDTVVNRITQNITKHVYGFEGKDVDELIEDGYKLLRLGDRKKANAKFRKALDIEPSSWLSWLGYASSGGDCSGYLSCVPAYIRAYNVATEDAQKFETFVDMTTYLPEPLMRMALIDAFKPATPKKRTEMFRLVSGVIGCDQSEIATLVIDLCPNDWRAYLSKAKFRQIRVKWCEPEGGFFSKPKLPPHAVEVMDLFLQAFRLGKSDSERAKSTVLSYISVMEKDSAYRGFIRVLNARIKQEG